MRTATSSILTGMALAGGLALVAGAAMARDPDVDGSARSRECPAVPGKGMDGYVLKVAWAEGKTRAEALEQARRSARSQLETQLCQGYTPLRCAAVRRHIQDWEDGHWDPPRRGRPGSACAAVTVERRYLDLVEHEYETFDRELEGLVGRVRDQLGDAPLVLDAPRWASDCNAGNLGAAINGELRKRLSGVRIATTDRRPEGGQLLRLTLTPGAETVTLDAGLRPVASDLEVGLGGLRFTPDLFAIPADETGDCAGEPTTGLSDRPGQDGLVVDVLFGAEDGLTCDGSQVPLSLYTNQPARVWLFSVAPDGTAYLIWPAAPGGGPVDGEFSLGTADICRYPGGDELLLAAALPYGHSWTTTAEWRGACRVSGALQSLGWPSAAAVGTVSYTVLPAGRRDCPERTTIDSEAMATALASLPLCGG